jgi:hypothetical protein
VCAIGFGWQLGLGFTTHLISAATYAAFACAALTGSPGAGAAIGTTFGLARGGLVYLVRGVHDPAELTRLHRRVLSSERRWRKSLRAVEIGIAAAGAAVVLAGYA